MTPRNRLLALAQWLASHLDQVVALALAGMFVAELASGSVKVDGPLWANITAAIVVSAPVAWHRRRPLAVFAFVIAAGALQSLTLTNFLGPSAGFLEFMYLAWATAARTDGRRSLAALALAVGGNALLTLTALDQTGNNVAASLVAFGLPLWLAGRGIALRGRLNRELAERARRLEHERDERGRLAAGEERARIAVELQRIVLGEVREMDALASAAGDLVETDPKAAVLAFAGVEQSGRDALAEMRRLLGVLREADEAGPTLAAAAEADQARARPRAPRRPAALPLYARTIGRLEPRTQDVVVAGAWTVLLALAGATSRNHGTSAAVGAAIAALFGIALLWRRRAPLLVIAAMLALALLGSLAHADGPAALVALCVGCYAAGRNAGPVERRLSWRLPFLPAAVMLLANPPALWSDVLFPTLFLLLAWAAGASLRNRELLADVLREKSERLVGEREARERAAVADERLRIARELHDVVAHTVGVMVLHASGGARAAERKPALAADAAQTIRDAARTALAEVDELVDSSQPVGASLDGLTDLAESAAAAGLGVALAVDPDLPPLDATVESVAYRVVREALTNAVKHAAPAEVLVKVRWSGDALEVEVADSGRSRDARERERTALAAAGGGHGLVGMNERVTRAGGSLEAGLRPEGGFVVRASLPAHGGRTVDERSPGRQEPAWNTESSAIRA